MTEKEWQEILAEMDHDDFKASRRYRTHNFSMKWIENLSDRTDPELDELKDIVEKAMSKLTWKQRRVLKLIYFHGLSRIEVAKILGCDPSAVGHLRRKALKELRKKLKL